MVTEVLFRLFRRQFHQFAEVSGGDPGTGRSEGGKMSSRSEKEKALEKAMRRLTPVFMRKLSPDVRHELYGRDQLTWMEYERIGTLAGQSSFQGVEELLKALRRRGPDILDILVECLEEEKEANSEIIGKIREVWPKTPTQETQPPEGPKAHPPISAEAERELLGNGEWPYPLSSGSPPQHVSIPPPPQEGVDHAPKMAYKMTSKPRGVGLIINNKHFTCNMKDRVGTDRDADALVKLFLYLGFYTNRYDDLKGTEMRRRLQDVADIDHSEFDCLMVAVMTHGINGKLYSTDGELIAVEDVTKYYDGMNCPSLIGKPKVFILQACRGGRFDYGVELESTDAANAPEVSPTEMKEIVEQQYPTIIKKALDDPDETDGGGYKGALPTEADFVLAYATVPGYVSWRNSEYGSWFVKAFVDTMYEYASKEHLMDILVEVNRRVAEEFQSKGRNKQIPSPVTMLTRKLFFKPGYFEHKRK